MNENELNSSNDNKDEYINKPFDEIKEFYIKLCYNNLMENFSNKKYSEIKNTDIVKKVSDNILTEISNNKYSKGYKFCIIINTYENIPSINNDYNEAMICLLDESKDHYFKVRYPDSSENILDTEIYVVLHFFRISP